MDYEKTLLGGILKTPYLIDIISTRLEPVDFTLEAHQKIYKKILEVNSQKDYFDYFIVEDALADDTNTLSVMHGLMLFGNEFVKEEVYQYIAHIKENKKVTALKNIGAFLTNSKSYANSSIDDLVTSTSRQLFNLAEAKLENDISASELVKQMQVEIEMYKDKELWGYPTGFGKLDRITRGMQNGQIWVVGAYTSVGKSWFCLNMANTALKEGAKVLYLSTEMVEKRLAWRFVAMNTGIPEYDMIQDKLTPESRDRRDLAIEELKTKPIQFISGITKIDEVIFFIKREIAKEQCDFVVVDFLQNLATGKDEYEDLSNAIRKLQTLALRENVCVVVASQVNRESHKYKTSSDTFGYKGSGTIEACADVGIIIKKEQDSGDDLTVDVKKNRNGMTTTFKVQTNFSIGRIKEYDL